MSRSSLFGLPTVPRDADVRPEIASWYTPSWSDPLGDRLLMFDNVTASGLELLRFRPDLGEAEGFEAALRARVADMAGLQIEGVAPARSVRWLGDREGLALVSTHVTGRRLSEMLGEARGAGFAAELLRQLAPVLAAFHAHRPGLFHGTLTPARIVATASGQLVVTEAAVGGALAALQLPADHLRGVLGLPTGPSGELGPAEDVTQLGFVALSLLIGRIVAADTPTDRLGRLLEQQAAMPWGPGYVHVHAWLERALNLSTPFSSSEEASAVVASWPEGELPPFERRPKLVVHPNAEPKPGSLASSTAADPTSVFPAEPTFEREAPVRFPTPTSRTAPTTPAQPRPEPQAPARAAAPAPAAAPARPRRGLVAALATLSVVEAAAIVVLGTMLWRVSQRPVPASTSIAPPAAAQPAAAAPAPTPPAAGGATAAATTTGRLEIASDPVGARVTVDGTARGETPLTLALSPGEHAIVLTSGTTTTRRTVTVAAGATSTLMASLGAVGSAGGWISFDTPLDLQVSEGGTLIGTTRASRLMLPAGTHKLDLTNPTLGVQDSLTVDVQAGRTVAARITVPNGSLSLNALPWANVWLNNQSLGTTPFANLSVPVGTHEVIWRHPQFGERRQTVVVTTRTPVRVVMDLTK